MVALKQEIKTYIIALPLGILLLAIMILVIKTMYDRHDGGPLWYLFFALVPFLGYAGFISQLEDIKNRMAKAAEYKRTGEKPERTKKEKIIVISSLIFSVIDMVITFAVSKKAGLAFLWLGLFCSTILMIVKPGLFFEPKADWDEDTTNRMTRSVRLSGVFSSCFILLVAYLTLRY